MYVLMIVFILLSCSKSNDPSPPGNGVEFSVKASVLDIKTSTRTAYEGNDLTVKPLTALVLTSNALHNYATANVVCNGTMTFKSASNVVYNKPVTSGRFLFPEGTATYYMSALHPATGWNLTATNGKALRTLTGKDDVMVAPQRETTAAAVVTGTYPTMAFAHKLALLRLWFSGDAEAIAAATTVTDIQLTSITDAAIPANIEINLSSASQTVTFAGAAPMLNCYGAGKDTDYASTYAQGYPVTDTPVEIAYTLAPPTLIDASAGNYEYTFMVGYAAGGTNRTMSIHVDLAKTITGDIPAGKSTGGYAFNITFNFVGGQIHAMATVAEWKDGSELNMGV